MQYRCNDSKARLRFQSSHLENACLTPLFGESSWPYSLSLLSSCSFFSLLFMFPSFRYFASFSIISLSFDPFSILTRVSENRFFYLFRFFLIFSSYPRVRFFLHLPYRMVRSQCCGRLHRYFCTCFCSTHNKNTPTHRQLLELQQQHVVIEHLPQGRAEHHSALSPQSVKAHVVNVVAAARQRRVLARVSMFVSSSIYSQILFFPIFFYVSLFFYTPVRGRLRFVRTRLFMHLLRLKSQNKHTKLLRQHVIIEHLPQAQQSVISPAQRSKTRSTCRSERDNASRNRQELPRLIMSSRIFTALCCDLFQNLTRNRNPPGQKNWKKAYDHKQPLLELDGDPRRICLHLFLISV